MNTNNRDHKRWFIIIIVIEKFYKCFCLSCSTCQKGSKNNRDRECVLFCGCYYLLLLVVVVVVVAKERQGGGTKNNKK